MSLSLIKPDHLVVIARTLADGIDYIADALRAVPTIVETRTVRDDSTAPIDENGVQTDRPNGQNEENSASMGTHSAQLALWDGLYLEVTAIDPDADAPALPRWYGLDSQAVRLRAAHGPFLAHWVARVERPRKLGQWATQYPRRIAPVRTIRHGRRAATAAVDPSGAFPAWRGAGDGLLPTLIQWDDADHPAATLPETGIALKALRGFHPSPELIGEQLRWLGLDPLLTIEPTLVEPSLFAEFDTPSGVRTLK